MEIGDTMDTDNSNPKRTADVDRVRPNAPVSLALAIHLFCVFVALSGSLFRSSLQERLLRVLAPYTQLLGLDPSPATFYLTHGMPGDSGHHVEILPEGQDAGDERSWVVVADDGTRGGEAYRRQQQLASVIGSLVERLEMASRDKRADEEANAACSLLLRSIAAHLLSHEGLRPQQIRCRRHAVQDIESLNGAERERDPFSANYFQEVYRAHTIVLDQGQVEVIRPSTDAGEVARPDGK
jgi:hypothetical protein